AVEHVIAEADQAHLAERCGVLEDAFVDALVASAAEDQVLAGCEVAGGRLREDLTRRRGEDDGGPSGPAASQLIERLTPGLGLHDHARSAAVGRVVDGAVPIVSPVPQVVDVQVQEAGLLRPAEQGQRQPVEVRGEDRDDVETHAQSDAAEASSAAGAAASGAGSSSNSPGG